MPEGDTLRRTADVIGRALGGRTVEAARGRPGGARLDLVVGDRIEGVRSVGKHLLIGFERGMTLHTHLGMSGSWHRYRPGERWRADPDDAVAVLEVDGSVAVCFAAPTVELIETRALALHPVLGRLGPDLLAPEPDVGGAVARLRGPRVGELPIAVALLDQRAVAGLGNVYRSEVLFIERVDPFAPVRALPADRVTGVVRSGARLLAANVDGPARDTVTPAAAAPRRRGRGALWVYGRTGRPCRRCGSRIRSTTIGELPRRLYWCPTCQAPDAAATP